MSLKIPISKSMKSSSEQIECLREALDTADAVAIGAGAGLSASAGFSYSSKRFRENFSDFEKKYGFHDMYSGGFYPYETLEEFWGFWSRNIWLNRYTDAPKPVYQDLYELVKDKDYFVLTTNVDHCFQKAGFDKKRLFYTQGDYGLFQCSVPCHQKAYDNEEVIKKMMETQENMQIPSDLVPKCPVCGKPMSTNLRCDDTFVEDEGWHQAAEHYSEFNRRHEGLRTLYLELGVGFNTPAIIKYPFWQMALKNPSATYACINYGDAASPSQIAGQSICIDDDIGRVLGKLL